MKKFVVLLSVFALVFYVLSAFDYATAKNSNSTSYDFLEEMEKYDEEIIYESSSGYTVIKQGNVLYSYRPEEDKREFISTSCTWVKTSTNSFILFEDKNGINLYAFEESILVFKTGTYDLSKQTVNFHGNFFTLYNEETKNLIIWAYWVNGPFSYQNVTSYQTQASHLIIDHGNGISILVDIGFRKSENININTHVLGNIVVDKYGPSYVTYKEDGKSKLLFLHMADSNVVDFDETNYDEVIYTNMIIFVKIAGEYYSVNSYESSQTSILTLDEEPWPAEEVEQFKRLN